MINLRVCAAAAIALCTIILYGCGSDAHGAYSGGGSGGGGNTAPSAPANLAGNAGDSAVSLGWQAPTTGSAPFTYNITITPASASAAITSNGTHAFIQGLTNNTTYTFSVTAKNTVGESSAVTILLKPIEAVTAFKPFTYSDPNSPSGVLYASLLNSGGSVWMTYSSVNNYQQSGLVQDVSTNLAYSNDSGSTFTFLTTISSAQAAIINSSTLNPCGNIGCNGRWVYGKPFLVDDASDPNSSQRYKSFALKYFIYPPATTITSNQSATYYAFGAIVMRTAALPGNTWSTEQTVLSWDNTPNELSPMNNIKNINSALTECIALIEGSATTYQGDLDFAFACPNSNGTQKIVLLRSDDHAKTFEYVSTPLTATDALSFNASYLYFSAPTFLATESSAPVLMVTPVINRAINGFTTNLNAYSGCIAFAFSDEEAGTLFRNNSVPMTLLKIPYVDRHLNGACAWERGMSVGILMNDGDPFATEPFSIVNTTAKF